MHTLDVPKQVVLFVRDAESGTVTDTQLRSRALLFSVRAAAEAMPTDALGYSRAHVLALLDRVGA